MKYIISWIETKNPDWKVANLKTDAGVMFENVSINRTNKKGEVFPMFDNIMNGGIIEGEFWETPDKSKKYLFPPREEKSSPRAFSRQPKPDFKEAQEIKRQNIEKAQDRSAWMWAKNNASELISRSPRMEDIPYEELHTAILDLATKIYNGEPLPF